MAFSQDQVKRVRVAVLAASALAVAILAFVVFSGALTPQPRHGGQAAQGQQASGSADASDSSKADGSGQDADGGNHTMSEVDATYGTAADQLESRYKADPSDAAALLNLANGYFDWGVAAMNHAVDDAGRAHATEIFQTAIGHYDAYLEDNASKSAQVDRAICVFYSGDHTAAVSDLEAFTKKDPAFAPAWANLGMFYEADGKRDQALEAYDRAIKAAGDQDTYGVKAYAQQRIDTLSGE